MSVRNDKKNLADAKGEVQGIANVVEVRDVSKTYCRDLQKSLWYGVKDIFREMSFRKSYAGELREKEFQAVKDASFNVKSGECVAMLGPNGAGKSSMLKMMNGILRPNSGSIRIRGRVSALIELGTGFNPVLSGRENVFINASVLGFSREETEEKFDAIMAFSEIGEFIDAPVQTYSSGMRVRLGFAVASHLSPDLLLIDEVLAVGDLAFRIKCYDHLQKQVESGMAVILVSHIVAMMPKFCTRAIVFEKGKIAFDGDIIEGIAEYQRILGIEKAKSGSIQHLEDDLDGVDESGNKPMVSSSNTSIATARTLSLENEEKNVFKTGDSLRLEVRIHSELDQPNCAIVANLNSSTFGNVSTMASRSSKFNVDLKADADTVLHLTLDQLPLVDGAYSFNLSLYGSERAMLLDQKSALASFKILNERARSLKGVLALSPDWKNVS